MKCQYCGSELPNGTKICSVCGSPVEAVGGTIYAGGNDAADNAPYMNTVPQPSYGNGQGNNNFYQPQNSIPDYNQQQFNQPMGNIPQMQNAPQMNNYNYTGQPQMVQNGQMPFQNDFGQQPLIPLQPNMTKRQLLNLPNLAKIKKDINGVAVLGYICVFATIAYNLFMAENPAGLIDAAILLGLTLGIQLKCSRVCAIALLVYSIINFAICVAAGSANGFLIVLVGAYAVKATSDFNKYWKSYKNTGGIPPVISNRK